MNVTVKSGNLRQCFGTHCDTMKLDNNLYSLNIVASSYHNSCLMHFHRKN